ncbi:hypothetical protein O3P69_002372 [Scylla paramamosain]|uniref:Uncharacterized protein n=1 Tax=Scylla paramamosain TaxID=85552 RepID=A0AAW0V8D5_SCYPA
MNMRCGGRRCSVGCQHPVRQDVPRSPPWTHTYTRADAFLSSRYSTRKLLICHLTASFWECKWASVQPVVLRLLRGGCAEVTRALR